MKNIFYTAVCSLSMLPLLVGCAEEDLQDFFPTEYHKILYILESGEQTFMLKNTVETFDTAFTVCKAGSDPSLTASVDIQIISQEAIDEEYTKNEGVPYKVIPETCYRLGETKLNFGKNETSKKIPVTLYPKKISEAIASEAEDTRWLLPIEAVSQTDSVNSQKSTCILHINMNIDIDIDIDKQKVQLLNLTDWTVEACSQEMNGEMGQNSGPADRVIDGNLDTFWATWWKDCPSKCGFPHYLILDAKTKHEISQIGLHQRNDPNWQTAKNVNVYISSDKSKWYKIGTYTCQPGTNEQKIDLIPSRGRYIKLEFTDFACSDFCFALAEVKVYGIE